MRGMYENICELKRKVAEVLGPLPQQLYPICTIWNKTIQFFLKKYIVYPFSRIQLIIIKVRDFFIFNFLFIPKSFKCEINS